MRNEMLAWMKRTEDPALVALENRASPAALKQFVTADPEKPDVGTKRKMAARSGRMWSSACKPTRNPIESIANNGIRFTNGYVSSPVCSPA